MKTKLILAVLATAATIHADEWTKEWSLCFTNGKDGPVFVARFVNDRMVEYPIVYPGRSVEAILSALKQETNYDAVLLQLATSGEICRVRGHAWFTPPHLTLEYRTEPYQERQCSVCGKFESRSMPPWPTPGPAAPNGIIQLNNIVWTNAVVGTNATFNFYQNAKP